MLAFADIEGLVEEQLSALASQPECAGAFRSYRIRGGDEAAQPWRVAGFYGYEGKNKRVVFEALYLEALGTCVVRVFRESRLQSLYARKEVSALADVACRRTA